MPQWLAGTKPTRGWKGLKHLKRISNYTVIHSCLGFFWEEIQYIPKSSCVVWEEKSLDYFYIVFLDFYHGGSIAKFCFLLLFYKVVLDQLVMSSSLETFSLETSILPCKASRYVVWDKTIIGVKLPFGFLILNSVCFLFSWLLWKK